MSGATSATTASMSRDRTDSLRLSITRRMSDSRLALFSAVTFTLSPVLIVTSFAWRLLFSRIESEMQPSVLRRRSELALKEPFWRPNYGLRVSKRAKWLVIEWLISYFLLYVLCWYRVLLAHEFALKRSLKPPA